MRLSIEAHGEEQLSRDFKGAAGDASDLRRLGVWRPVSDVVLTMAREQILSAGRRGGHPYQKHAASTVQNIISQNRRRFQGIGELLRRTDAMFRAVGTRGAPHGILIEEAQELTMGTDLIYAAMHQRGGTRLPQRMIYDPTEKDEKEIGRAMKQGIAGKWEDRGLDYRETSSDIPF